MPLPCLGTALRRETLELLRDWIMERDRPIEIQDFIYHVRLVNDVTDLIADYRRALSGHAGPRGLHGPFFGFDIDTTDPDVRAIAQARLIRTIEIADALEATQMVVHSPFTFWHTLNYANYTGLREQIFEATAECLAPVLERARRAGVELVLENIDDACPFDRVDLVRTIDHPFLKVSLDTGHADLAHGQYKAPPVVDYVAAAGAMLAHVHLQDADGHADRHWHPGDGRIPWTAVFDALGSLPSMPRLILEVRANFERIPETVRRLEDRGLAC